MPNRMSTIPAWTWILGAVLLIAIIFIAGYRVQAQKDLQTVQSELAKAQDEAVQANAQVADLKKQAASLNTELDKANAQHNELQTKLGQATTEIEFN